MCELNDIDFIDLFWSTFCHDVSVTDGKDMFLLKDEGIYLDFGLTVC